MIKVGENTYDTGIKIANERPNREVIIGKYCSLGNNISVITDGHVPTNFTTYPFGHTKPTQKFNKAENHKVVGNVIVGNDVWIGDNVVLMYGCRIADGAIIGANSVVRGRVKPYSVMTGNPAMFLYYRFNKDIIDLLLDLKWWDLPEETVKQYSDILFSNDIIELKRIYKEIKSNSTYL